MKEKYIDAHMKVAEVYASLSSAKRLQVGCVVVKDNTIIGIGYNGMPSGWTNECEDIDWDKGAGGWLSPEEFDIKYPFEKWHEEAGRNVRYGLKTKVEVLHAESNALAKIARSTNSSEGAAAFVTHAPCVHCAKMLYQAGINSVYYRNSYRDEDGINFLTKCGVEVKKV